ncbi:MAG: cation transporter [Salinisphaeraceae bacterium]|nr:cation transporter [Salinisphaeraceae bacterium]
MHSHAGHAHTSRAEESGRRNARRLQLALAITLGFALIEAVAGWLANSLALLGDAGHMLTDSSALALAAIASVLARRPATTRLTYGMGRLEVIAAMINALFMLAVVAGIIYGALMRFGQPVDVNGPLVIVVGSIGLLLNLALFRVLSHDHGDLNTRGALLHVLGDLLGSVAAVTSGVVIWWTGWSLIDPVLSLLICLLIVAASLKLLGRALRVVMEGVPPHLEIEEIGMRMAATDGVLSVHDLHVWNLSSSEVALSAHIVLRDMSGWPDLLARLRASLADRYGITHTTLQPETPEAVGVPIGDILRSGC